MGGSLYVCGGSSGLMHTPLCSVERLDISVGVWKPVPAMAERRRGAAVAAMGGKLYVAGGTYIEVLSSAERFDPETSTWNALPPMSVGRHCAVAAATAGCLYVFGGSSGNGQFLSSAEKFS